MGHRAPYGFAGANPDRDHSMPVVWTLSPLPLFLFFFLDEDRALPLPRADLFPSYSAAPPPL